MQANHNEGKQMKTVIGMVSTANRARAEVVIERNPSGNVTVSGPNMMRDYCYFSAAVRFAKKVYSHPTNEARWSV